ncbi:MAG: PepSY domain-containing protein [Anaerolineales bacterium]
MKIHRSLALAAIAILLFGGAAFTSSRGFAQGSQPPSTPQVQTQTGNQDQSGNQVEDGAPDTSSELAGVESTESASPESASGESAAESSTADPGPDQQSPSYAGSISISPSQSSGMSESDEAAALQSQANISASQAESAALSANPGASVTESELDNENGVLVYSVELSNGSEVKVDAGTGQVLHTEQAENGENE